jgi:hypothetical protein
MAHADGWGLHPSEPGETRNEVVIKVGCKGRLGVGQRGPQSVAIPDVYKPVLGKLARKPSDVLVWQNPSRVGADNANDDVHALRDRRTYRWRRR